MPDTEQNVTTDNNNNKDQGGRVDSPPPPPAIAPRKNDMKSTSMANYRQVKRINKKKSSSRLNSRSSSGSIKIENANSSTQA